MFIVLSDDLVMGYVNHGSLKLVSRSDSESARLAIYDKAHDRYPRALLPVTLPLHFLTGDSFRSRVDAYVKKALRKGIPPLFVQLRSDSLVSSSIW